MFLFWLLFLSTPFECGLVPPRPCAMVNHVPAFSPVPVPRRQGDRLSTVPEASPLSFPLQRQRERQGREVEQRNCCKPLKLAPVSTSPLC